LGQHRAGPRPRAPGRLGIRAPRLPRRRAPQGPLKSSPSSHGLPAVPRVRPAGRTAVGPVVTVVCPPIAHVGQDLGLCAALMVLGMPGGRPPYKREPLVRGGPVPRGTPSIPGRAPANLRTRAAPAESVGPSPPLAPKEATEPLHSFSPSLPHRKPAAAAATSPGRRRARPPASFPHRPSAKPNPSDP
jgi:hypothetical protein